ncbi:hypothetical protein ACWPN4_23000 [Gordonia polyisoprenivorans]
MSDRNVAGTYDPEIPSEKAQWKWDRATLVIGGIVVPAAVYLVAPVINHGELAWLLTFAATIWFITGVVTLWIAARRRHTTLARRAMADMKAAERTIKRQ